MFRIDHPTAAVSLPAPAAAGTPGFFTEGNPTSGTPATVVTADWANLIQEEILNVLLAAGITPNKASRTQLSEAIALIATGGGSAGALMAVNNLSDLTNVSTARTSLGLGGLAVKSAAAISDVTGLGAVLDGKVNDIGDTMTGALRINMDPPAPGPSSYNDGHIELRTSAALNPRIGFHRTGNDGVALTFMGGMVMRLHTSSGATADLYHTGNFDPSAKANLVGGANFTGVVTATGGFQNSDARMKHTIVGAELRPLHRHIPFKQWLWNSDGSAGKGAIAQDVLAVDSVYVHEHESEDGPRLSIDKAGIALEQSMWAGNEVDRLLGIIESLTERINALESRA